MGVNTYGTESVDILEKDELLKEIGTYTKDDLQMLIKQKRRIDAMRQGEIKVGRKSKIDDETGVYVVRQYLNGVTPYRLAKILECEKGIEVTQNNVINYLKRQGVYKQHKEGECLK